MPFDCLALMLISKHIQFYIQVSGWFFFIIFDNWFLFLFCFTIIKWKLDTYFGCRAAIMMIYWYTYTPLIAILLRDKRSLNVNFHVYCFDYTFISYFYMFFFFVSMYKDVFLIALDFNMLSCTNNILLSKSWQDLFNILKPPCSAFWWWVN